MQISVSLIRKLEQVDPALRDVLVAILEEMDRRREETVTKKEFNELKEIVRELAEAQKETQRELRKLVGEHVKTREQLGGLSATVGYILENEAIRALPGLLLEEFGLRVKDGLVRKFLEDVDGNPMEVNIVGEALGEGKEFLVVGESKSQLSKGKVKEFLDKKLKRLPKPFGLEVFPILVTHMISSPEVVEYALQKGIKRIYYSYEFS